jgi:hypothetical protein
MQLKQIAGPRRSHRESAPRPSKSPAQLIAETSKLFFLDQKLFSRLEPLVWRNDFVIFEVCRDHMVIFCCSGLYSIIGI